VTPSTVAVRDTAGQDHRIAGPDPDAGKVEGDLEDVAPCERHPRQLDGGHLRLVEVVLVEVAQSTACTTRPTIVTCGVRVPHTSRSR
jgi:hypothetical protein